MLGFLSALGLRGCLRNGQETREGGAGPGWTLLGMQSRHRGEH